jgi:hypothetical protein
MLGNEIIAEVRRHREAFARECRCDVRDITRRLREDEQHFASFGHPIVSFVHAHDPADSASVREEPPKE